jgi:S-adenosylmethionine:tRNA ribosyltransferase-isomerase
LADRDKTGLDDVESYALDIPEELIAQDPAVRRDASRLMRIVRPGRVEHRKFSDLPDILRPGDMLVLNDTKVMRARVKCVKIPGGASAEVFFLSPSGGGAWRALVRPGRRLPPGSRVMARDGTVITIGERFSDGSRSVRADVPASDLMERSGQIPLPPYIKHSSAPEDRYQTVYSDPAENRSAAAPTAGLHFTPELLDELAKRGVEREFVTLDVGIGTFRPVKTPDIRDHVMHTEHCALREKSADRINGARAAGRRVIAVGTTVLRTLESFADESGSLRPGERETGIFIRPGIKIRTADALLTNFHLPKSTLLMLVAAFAGYETTMSAYKEAVRERYRFFSFGDSMLIE